MRVPAALSRARFPAPILQVLGRLGAAGHRSWLVGGAVRDLLLHRPRAASDFDVATPATPAEVEALFARVVPTGIQHGTVTVLLGGDAVEVTTFRGEGAYVDGRRPESVTFHTDLEADLARRDFTMNALAFDPLGAEFRDPFGGRGDMRRRLVRAVGDAAARFAEDGLRPMRAVRFAAQLGYGLHPKTRAAIPHALPVVRKVAVERIADEIELLLVAPHAGRGLELMRRSGLLATVLPEVAALPSRKLAHAIAVLRGVEREPAVRFAALLHALGPGAAERILSGLRLPRRLASEVAALVRSHACSDGRRPAPAPEVGPELRRWVSRAGPERVPALVDLARAEAGAAPPSRARAARAAAKALASAVAELRRRPTALSARDLALGGGDVMRILGAEPGPLVGDALRHLLDRVLEDPSLNEPTALSEEVRRWWAARQGRI